MNNGYRVVDADTHVDPAAEVPERYVDPDFRAIGNILTWSSRTA